MRQCGEYMWVQSSHLRGVRGEVRLCQDVQGRFGEEGRALRNGWAEAGVGRGQGLAFQGLPAGWSDPEDLGSS